MEAAATASAAGLAEAFMRATDPADRLAYEEIGAVARQQRRDDSGMWGG